jgi:thiol:disulfide interchange protein
LAIIGLVINILSLVYFIWAISYFGLETLQNPELMQEKMRELQGM